MYIHGTSVYVGNQKILLLGKGLMQELHDTTLTAGAEYHNNFTEQGTHICLSLNCNGSNI